MKVEFTTRGVMTTFFRQRWKFMTVFMLVMASGLAYIALTKPQYEAGGSLLVKFGRGATPDIVRADSSMPQIISQNDRRETIQSDMDILQSHDLLREVVREFGVEKLYPGITAKLAGSDKPEEAVIHELWKSDLTVKSGEKTNLIDVRLVNESPDIAAAFVHELFQRFIARQSDVFNRPQTNFLGNEVKQAAEKLNKSQAELEAFKSENGISSIEDELAELLRQKSDAGTVSLDANDDAWAHLADMQAKEAQMASTYLPGSPQVQRQHDAVLLAQRQLRQRKADLAARTSSAMSQINKRIAVLETKRSRYNDFIRQVKTDEENYKNYVARSEDARINETLNRSNITPITVVDEPVAPVKPLRPRKKLVLSMCLLAGLVFGLATVMAFETFDQRFTSPAQISQLLGVPVMANFNKIA